GIHINAIAANFDDVTRSGHDAFDGHTLVSRIFDDNNFAGTRRAPEIRTAEEQVTLTVEKRGAHADALDLNRHEHVMSDEKIAEERTEDHRGYSEQLAFARRRCRRSLLRTIVFGRKNARRNARSQFPVGRLAFRERMKHLVADWLHHCKDRGKGETQS